MNNDSNNLFTVTEFARRTNVTAETLRYYHRIGLLSPSYIDPENGYRYYTLQEFEEVGVIQALQSLGLSLADIKYYLEHKTLDSSYALLNQQYQSVCQQLDSLKKIKSYLKDKLQSFDSLLNSGIEGQIIEKKLHSRSGYYTLTPCNSYRDYQLECARLMEHYDKQLFLGNSFCVICKEAPNSQYQYYSLVLNIQKPEKTKSLRQICPSQYYLCTQFRGNFLEGIEYIEKLKSYMDSRGYHQNGDILMVCLTDENYTNLDEERITEIQIPIQVSAKP